jgi:hypothetical protein
MSDVDIRCSEGRDSNPQTPCDKVSDILVRRRMTKPLRSPVLGYNHNLRYRGRLFHVQTEDSGPTNPRLYTHLFFEGTILSSKKHEYDASLHEDDVKALMQGLHKAMIRELTHGDHDSRIIAFFAARGQVAFAEPAPVRPDAAPAPAPVSAPQPATRPAPQPVADAAPPPAYVIQVTGSDPGAGRQPQPVQQAAAAQRPVVVIKPTDIKRPPMVFSQSADGVVVQRSVVVGAGAGKPGAGAQPQAPSARIRPAVPYVVREGSHAIQSPARPAQQTVAGPAHAAPAQVQPVAAQVPVPRAASPADKPFSDLVSDKSLDEVILEYLSDDGEPERR